VITPLLDQAKARRENDNGVYNTIVTLKDLSRAITQPRKAEINTFCSDMSSGRARIAQQCANLRLWLETQR